YRGVAEDAGISGWRRAPALNLHPGFLADLGSAVVDAMRAPSDPDAGYENFGAVEVRIETMDVLDLARSGHRRAVFSFDNGAWSGGWRAP
ncbi:MAG: hypothetical protein AAFU55_13870, partial [Pseudomonadota bacterium]